MTPPRPFRPLPFASFLFAFSLALLSARAGAQSPPPALDSDNDGLSDALEQSLIAQFAPHFFIGHADCSNLPAEFEPNLAAPQVKSENGAIYAQVFPAQDPGGSNPSVEIHYYHLWRIDCGPHGHPLDTEHVSALVRASGSDLSTATWHALYWYAAAHENTVCDVSQIAHASTLHAQDDGPAIWISPGKHASYLDRALCQKGCGADRCVNMEALAPASLINLGEPNHPMNGSAFIASAAWPLAGKMSETNFPAPVLARLGNLPDSQIAWFNTGKHPAQGVIAISSATELDISHGGQIAAGATSGSLTIAKGDTGNALQKSYRNTIHALGAAAKDTGRFLNPPKQPGTSTPPAATPR